MPAPASVHDVLFPERISLGASGGAEFLTRIVTTGSGHEFRNINWDKARCRWNVAQGIKDYEEFLELNSFFRNRRGKAYGFRFKDWFDYRAYNSVFAVCDGVQTRFPLQKLYDDGGGFQVMRRVVLPADPARFDCDPLQIFMDGILQAGATVEYFGGWVNFANPPPLGAILSWEGEFHIPARFDIDGMNATLDSHDVYSWGDITVVELRQEEVIGG